jgi:hypothetical protein
MENQYCEIKGNLIPMGKKEDVVIQQIVNDVNICINGKLEEITFSLGEVNEGSDSSIKARDEVVKKKVKYTPAHLKAQNKYREKNREKYNEAQRLLYEKKIQEEEWQKHYLERSRVNNKKYRDKKKEEMIASGEYVEKKRGRPRKVDEDVVLETKDIKDD